MSRKWKPFSDEYNKRHRELHRTVGILCLVLAFLMMVAGIYFDATDEDFNFTDYLIVMLLFLVLGNVSFHRQSQFVENEAIYKAIQARQKE